MLLQARKRVLYSYPVLLILMLSKSILHARSNFSPLVRCASSRVVMIAGGKGGLGQAFIERFIEQAKGRDEEIDIIATSSQFSSPSTEDIESGKLHKLKIDIRDYKTFEEASEWVNSKFGRLDMLINCIGMLHGKLHDKERMPEKTFLELDPEWMMENFRVNTLPTAMLAKRFCPMLAEGPSDTLGIFAALSARIGSIEDNKLGGWFSYRASKAALHQYMRTLSIELDRKYKAQEKNNKRKVISACLHPGTVDTGLSEPFQKNIDPKKLFTPEYSTNKLLSVLESLTEKQNGRIFDYAGQEIPA